MAVNASEALVERLARRSFLSLWSYANPRGKNGKELCDVLVVCDPDVIIFSVKDIAISGDTGMHADRWRRKAVDASCDQLYGAERWIRKATHVVRSDGSMGLPFPNGSRIRIHRVAVALGSQGKALISPHMSDRGFIHVIDETSLDVLMGELDTITDFVKYLSDKEIWLGADAGRRVIASGEEDVLALYLVSDRSFPTELDVAVIGDDLWKVLSSTPEFARRKEADRVSYAWDHLIEMVSQDILAGKLEFGGDVNETEQCMRLMAREHRFSRRVLAKSFREVTGDGAPEATRARPVESLSGVTYVLLAMPYGTDRQFRRDSLDLRCLVARNMFRDSLTVVGVATERRGEHKGRSIDLCLLYAPEWSEELIHKAVAIQKDLNYWVSSQMIHCQEDEYPEEQPSA